MLLDDDPTFREFIRRFLAAHGYTVVAVQNGAEGIREVLAGDFALILCDLRMPSVPGDTFYRAVERARPHLCGRFVFMTGSRDANTNDFIESVSGCLLRKPFHMNELLDWIAVSEVFGSSRSAFKPAAAASVLPRIREPTDPCPATVAQLPASMLTAESPVPLPGEQPEPGLGSATPDVCESDQTVCDFDPSVPGEEPVRPRAGSARLAGSSRSRPAAPAVESLHPPSAATVPAVPLTVERHSSAFALSALALPLVLALVLGLKYEHARVDAVDAVAEHQTFDAEWRVLAPQVEAALSARPALERTLGLPARIAADRAKPRWAWALCTITPSLEKNIELQGLRAHQMADAPGACDLRIDGVSFGPEARAIADRVRLKIEQELRRGRNSEPVKTGFLKLADEPESSSELSNQNRVAFEIVATVGVKVPAVFKASLRQ